MSSNEHNFEAYETDNPGKLSKRYFSFSAADLRFCGLMLGLTVIVGTLYGRPAVITMLGLWFGVLLWRLDNGRIYYLIGEAWHSTWIRVVKRGKLWEAKPSRRTWRAKLIRLFEVSEPIPLRINPLQGQGIDIGLIHHVRNQTDSVVVKGTGSSIPSESIPEQFFRHQRIAETLKKTASVRGYAIGTSLVFRRRPAIVQEVAGLYGLSLHPDVAAPKALLKPESEWTSDDRRSLLLHENALQVAEMVVRPGGNVTMASVWTIRREGLLASVAKGRKRLSRREVNRLPVVKVAQTAIDSLTDCGISEVDLLDFEETRAFMRGAWDVSGSDDYYDKLYANGDNSNGNTGPNHWPNDIVVGNDHIWMDGTYHSVVRIHECPTRLLPNFFRQLFGVRIQWLSIALVGETIKSRLEYDWLERVIPVREEVWRQLQVDHRGPKAQAKDRAIEKRQQDIFDSRFSQTYNLLCAVSATTLEQLEDDVDEMIRWLNTLGMSARRVRGESRQKDALLSATTGLSML